MISRNVLITGFEPFGKEKFNPVQDIAKELHGTIVNDKFIIWKVMPSIYGTFSWLKEIIIESDPALIINMGLASRVWWVRLETTWHNVMRSSYADNMWIKFEKEENKKILEHWPDTITSTLDLTSLKQKLESKINSKVEISHNAEWFICNDLLYRTSHFINTSQRNIKHIFIHIPRTNDFKEKIDLAPGKIFIPKEEVITSIKELIYNLT